MAAVTVVKTIGTTGVFSTPQLWEDGAPADLTTAEKSAATTFAVATFAQGESLTFVGSGATGKLLDTDSTGPGTGTYVTYGVTAGNPAASDVVTGGTSLATCVLTSGTPDNVGVIWEGQCQNQEFSSAATVVTLGGSINSSTTYKHLTTVAGASFRDHAGVQTNALRYNAANGAGLVSTNNDAVAVTCTEAGVRLSKLQLAGTGTGARAVSVGASTDVVLEFLICEGTYVATTNSAGILNVGSGAIVRNCLIIQRASAADHVLGLSVGSPSFYNCTIVAPDDLATAPTAILASGSPGAPVVQNCGLFAGDSTKAIKVGTGSPVFTTCYSDIAGTAGVMQATYANEFQNVLDATRDFRLNAGAVQVDTGTTDAANGSTDIAGTARPQRAGYDVGCWELVGPTAGEQMAAIEQLAGSGGVVGRRYV